jgi:hypothetical protein
MYCLFYGGGGGVTASDGGLGLSGPNKLLYHLPSQWAFIHHSHHQLSHQSHVTQASDSTIKVVTKGITQDAAQLSWDCDQTKNLSITQATVV